MNKRVGILDIDGDVSVWHDGSCICVKTKDGDPVDMSDHHVIKLAGALLNLLTPSRKLIIAADHYTVLFSAKWTAQPLPQVEEGTRILGIQGEIFVWNDGSCVLVEPEAPPDAPIRLTDHQALELAKILVISTQPPRMLVPEGDHYRLAYFNVLFQ